MTTEKIAAEVRPIIEKLDHTSLNDTPGLENPHLGSHDQMVLGQAFSPTSRAFGNHPSRNTPRLLHLPRSLKMSARTFLSVGLVGPDRSGAIAAVTQQLFRLGR